MQGLNCCKNTVDNLYQAEQEDLKNIGKIHLSNILLDSMSTIFYNRLMLSTDTVSVRDVLRNHKQILEIVMKTKKRLTIMSQNKPQAVIVSLEDLRRLEELESQIKYQQSTKSLLETAKKVRDVLKDTKLPADLSTRHDLHHYEDNS